MSELEMIKRGYFQGRMLWIQGPAGARKIRMAYEILGHCRVEESEVCVLDAVEWMNRFEIDLTGWLYNGVRVFVLKNLDSFDEGKQKRFLQLLLLAKRLYFTCGVRVILVSSKKLDWLDSVASHLRIFRLQLKGFHQGNLDERIHWALEIACKITQKRVTNLSEPAAQFLESVCRDYREEELLGALVYAVRNASNGSLSLNNFFRSDDRSRGPGDDPATCCN